MRIVYQPLSNHSQTTELSIIFLGELLPVKRSIPPTSLCDSAISRRVATHGHLCGIVLRQRRRIRRLTRQWLRFLRKAERQTAAELTQAREIM